MLVTIACALLQTRTVAIDVNLVTSSFFWKNFLLDHFGGISYHSFFTLHLYRNLLLHWHAGVVLLCLPLRHHLLCALRLLHALRPLHALHLLHAISLPQL